MTDTYPADATYNSTSMTNRKPDKGFSTESKFDAIILESQGGYETRRQRSRRPKRRYSLTYTNVTGEHKRAISDFYNERGGDFEAFYFNLTHINETGTVTVRFDGPLSVTHIHSASTDLCDNFYNISFVLQEVFT